MRPNAPLAAPLAAPVPDPLADTRRPPPRSELGERLNRIRKERRLTLDEVTKLTGLAASTLSKIENGLMSPTYDVLSRLTSGMGIDLAELFGAAPRQAMGARSITRAGAGTPHPTATYRHELLAPDLARKAMLPFRTRVTARDIAAFDGWVRHDGEEFLFVLSGQVEVLTELYAPAVLHPGDSIYLDSQMGHAVISVGEQDADVLWICCGIRMAERLG